LCSYRHYPCATSESDMGYCALLWKPVTAGNTRTETEFMWVMYLTLSRGEETDKYKSILYSLVRTYLGEQSYMLFSSLWNSNAVAWTLDIFYMLSNESDTINEKVHEGVHECLACVNKVCVYWLSLFACLYQCYPQTIEDTLLPSAVIHAAYI
jgi:hypothetical protein